MRLNVKYTKWSSNFSSERLEQTSVVLHRSVRMRSRQPMETSHSEWITSPLTKLSWQIFCSWLKGGTVQSLPASIRHHLPQEVSGSRWEVMELCGSVGGDMTSCQALMQPNIWSLLATSFLSCRRGPLAWSQKPPRGPEPGPRRQYAAAVMLNDSTLTSAVKKVHEKEEKRPNRVATVCALYGTSGKYIQLKITAWMCSNGRQLWQAANRWRCGA